MDFEVVVSALVALGVGGILGSYVQYKLQHKQDVESDIHKLKREKYGLILIQMLTILEPTPSLKKTQQLRPNLQNIDDIKAELRTEMLNSITFANDKVIEALFYFIDNPTNIGFIFTAQEMRKDLWGRKTNITKEVLQKYFVEDISKAFKD
jgi:hypothetical protein